MKLTNIRKWTEAPAHRSARREAGFTLVELLVVLVILVLIASIVGPRVIGYLGTRLFSKTLIWTRAPAEIGRCAAPTQATLTPSR